MKRLLLIMTFILLTVLHGCGNKDNTVAVCPVCKSTNHIQHSPCSVCLRTDHLDGACVDIPIPDECDFCGSIYHTTTEHPKCEKCESPNHNGTECQSKFCTYCDKLTEHTTETHPECKYCEAQTTHFSEGHPLCDKCGKLHKSAYDCQYKPPVTKPEPGKDNKDDKKDPEPDKIDCANCSGTDNGHTTEKCPKKTIGTVQCTICGEDHADADHPNCGKCGQKHKENDDNCPNKNPGNNVGQNNDSDTPSSNSYNCDYCGVNNIHNTENHPHCTVCGDKHAAADSNCPNKKDEVKCSICGEDHANADHPVCSKCGQKHSEYDENCPFEMYIIACTICGGDHADADHPVCSKCCQKHSEDDENCPNMPICMYCGDSHNIEQCQIHNDSRVCKSCGVFLLEAYHTPDCPYAQS